MLKTHAVKSAIILVAGLLMAGTVAAKEMKIAYVDVQAVAAKIPQAVAMQETIKKEFSDRIEAVNKLEKDIGFNIEKLRRDGPTMSEQQQEELKVAVTNQRKQYEELARPLDEEIRTRQAEERNKVLALIKTAIDVVAEREKIDMVLNSGAAVYAKPEFDISEAVMTQVSKAK
ncbi:OmpH family outer membrane protein [Rheinheimera baltica]|uniref:OmpH family outer membrane protein n=1 Tax=Rheinheimera baltica TaxID=67576 RepID=A0ABT9HXS1_9GAMM|nr:OmpH family outer membrane protein [Rheinheimera baltica]MDP5135919.1 OmpH family outer membrane protein [Rheinheimera baltica]MDP5141750.1 OmpH family outer membrane protein [Rheinheimera baltica]MDP5150269.1 OmpH family outer membrane protein [Rheinheimera baltica]MDP5189303.1 OmpH family outer membrane protein [Rheinheimera baltica]